MTKRVAILSVDRLTPEFLRRPLAPLGIGLSVAFDLDSLSALLQAEPHDAVFFPRRVPPSDNPIDDPAEIIAWLRSPSHGCGGAPPAAIVMGLDDRDRAFARDVGADGFLRLPFADTEVLEVLGASTRGRKVVLLADDSPLIHRHTVPILEEAGYEVVPAFDGEEALVKLRERRPDLVITDIEMPKMDGWELCRAIKQSADMAHLPVLICSSLGEAADLERGFDVGADDYMVKPVLPEELTTRIRTLLAGTMPASRERILVVDDSPAQRHYVQDCLARQGFDVVTAENGRIGLDRARELVPALVVSDYDMPEMTGFEMVVALKRDTRTRDIPVIMLTARDSRRDVAQMRAAGATAYLVKPFAQDKCIATVERTLAERRLHAYKEASRVYISEGAARAAEERARAGDLSSIRADERVVSVMFSDICGFTQLSGRMSPPEVIALLNAYFDVLCPIIKAEGGDIDKFIGDAIMAIFDEVPGRESPPIRAARAALAMQDAMPAFNQGRPVQLAMRIGVNTGLVVRGDLGSRYFRRDYTVIGDTVNRANRYEVNCPPGRVLVSQSTVDAAAGAIDAEPLAGLKLKGVDEPVTGWVVRAVAPPRGEA